MQLDDVDLDKRLSKDEAERTMPPLRTKLGELQRAARAKMVPVVLTFDGWDTVEMAEHVNGVIRALDPRGFELHSIEAPSQEESDHEFLWRFIRLLPPAGRIAIFDRSWYSRAAVDEVEARDSRGCWPATARCLSSSSST
jgi:polyphosphate kinase 2 (PPK2 family)